MSETTFIYALSDPRDPLNIRYIGKADNPKHRLSKHLWEMEKLGNTHKSCWIKNLSKQGLRPAISILDEVPKTHWQEFEKDHIQMARNAGFDLVNSTEGGEGFRSGKFHPNFGKKVVHSEDTLKILSRSQAGKKKPKHTSKFLGVSWEFRDRRWTARITLMGHGFYLGNYISEIEAAQTYDWVASLYERPINFPERED